MGFVDADVAAFGCGRQPGDGNRIVHRRRGRRGRLRFFRHDDPLHAAEQQRVGGGGYARLWIDEIEIVIQRHKRVAALATGAAGSRGTGRGGRQQLGGIAAGQDGGLDVFHAGDGFGSLRVGGFLAVNVGVQHRLGVAAQVEPAAIVELDGDCAGIGCTDDFIGIDDIADDQDTFNTVRVDRNDLTDDCRDDANLLRCHGYSPD